MKTLIKTMLVAFIIVAITPDANAHRKNEKHRYRHAPRVLLQPQHPICMAPPARPVVYATPRMHGRFVHQPRWVPAHWAIGRFGERVWVKGHYE